MFSQFRSKIRVHGNRRHEYILKIEPTDFHGTCRFTVAIKLVSQFLKITENVENWENIIFKNFHFFQNVPKVSIAKNQNLRIRTPADEYVYKTSSRYLKKKRLSFGVLNAPKGHFLR